MSTKTELLGKVDNLKIYRHTNSKMVTRYSVKVGQLLVAHKLQYSEYPPHYKEAIARVAHG